MKEINSPEEREETLAELREPLYYIVSQHCRDLGSRSLECARRYLKDSAESERFMIQYFEGLKSRAKKNMAASVWNVDVYATLVTAIGGNEKEKYLEKARSLLTDMTRHNSELNKLIALGDDRISKDWSKKNE